MFLTAIIIRKSYAGAHYGMLDKAIGADFALSGPRPKSLLSAPRLLPASSLLEE